MGKNDPLIDMLIYQFIDEIFSNVNGNNHNFDVGLPTGLILTTLSVLTGSRKIEMAYLCGGIQNRINAYLDLKNMSIYIVIGIKYISRDHYVFHGVTISQSGLSASARRRFL